tara:strand:- start:4798 stop:5787 length:990 start_codon:yes stop_codon:yes gene_type:complete
MNFSDSEQIHKEFLRLLNEFGFGVILCLDYFEDCPEAKTEPVAGFGFDFDRTFELQGALSMGRLFKFTMLVDFYGEYKFVLSNELITFKREDLSNDLLGATYTYLLQNCIENQNHFNYRLTALGNNLAEKVDDHIRDYSRDEPFNPLTLWEDLDHSIEFELDEIENILSKEILDLVLNSTVLEDVIDNDYNEAFPYSDGKYHIILDETNDGKEVILDLVEEETVKPMTVKDVKNERAIQSEGFVYLGRSTLHNFTKIGWSKTPKVREKTLQAEDPCYSVLYHFPAVQSEETALHTIYKEKRTRGEWFSLTQKDVNAIVGLSNSIISILP